MPSAQIHRLSVQAFRNLTAVDCHFDAKFNFFCGNNGSGKTSLLEALYYLGHAKSFRTPHCTRLIQYQHDRFQLLADGISPLDTLPLRVGIERNRLGERRIRANQEELRSIAPITQQWPMQFMSPMSYRFFHDGPKGRRQCLDWALFHVEPRFLALWQDLQRILKQRNMALKQQGDYQAWNAIFVDTAQCLDSWRRDLVGHLAPLCLQYLRDLLPDVDFCLQYQRGWPDESDLMTLLNQHQALDRRLKYTYYGPQRADFQLFYHDLPVQDVLSQGQQKLAAYALHLALGQVLKAQNAKRTIYLIDDLPSELDRRSREKIIESLIKLDAQVFISAITADDLNDVTEMGTGKMFHVEHGELREGSQ
jgi:DNA replication and repair protein RecF